MSDWNDISDAITEEGILHDEEYRRARRDAVDPMPDYDRVNRQLFREGKGMHILNLGEWSLHMKNQSEPYIRAYGGSDPTDLTAPLADRPELRPAWIARLQQWLENHSYLEDSSDPIDRAEAAVVRRALEILGAAPVAANTKRRRIK